MLSASIRQRIVKFRQDERADKSGKSAQHMIRKRILEIAETAEISIFDEC